VAPLILGNGTCVKEMKRRNRKEEGLERVMKYYKLLKTGEINPLGNIIGQEKSNSKTRGCVELNGNGKARHGVSFKEWKVKQ
jgi:hypothetical protein